jgi:hypothetical protein
MNANQTFSESQLDTLRAQYAALNTVDPCGVAWGKLEKMVSFLSDDQLRQLALANVKFLSVHCACVLRERDDCPANVEVWKTAARNVALR